ncbi:hypothetical protein E2C01_037168 [Portunus trituberculatus]|uniref:Uncharacterized protein n=1 Tax=Portunus trituberculatus TaxID=210409 RepID=A0A5B7FE86_PORTR|nr:hypothetical protein [Portunus trituberculatus]
MTKRTGKARSPLPDDVTGYGAHTGPHGCCERTRADVFSGEDDDCSQIKSSQLFNPHLQQQFFESGSDLIER